MSNADERDTDQPAPGGDLTTTRATVQYFFPDNLNPEFSDVAFVAHTKFDFRLSFYQTKLPVYGPGQKAEVVSARCVAQIILTPQHAKQILDTLQKNYASYIAGKEFSADATSNE